MQVIPYVQMALAILVIALVLIQERTAGTSSLLGGTGEGMYQTRRGLERVIFASTIAATTAFGALALAQLYFARY